MASLKSLAKDTAIYGISSIVGRFLNYLLFPLYTHVIAAASGGNGVITEVYSYTALLFVMLTFGMETTLFRFINREEEQNPLRVYTTVLSLVGSVGLLFVGIVLLNLGGIAQAMGYADHPEYIGMMAATVALDAFQAIPYCYLRYQRRPLKFATLKLSFILLNVAMNLLFFLVFPRFIEGWTIEVGHVFAINLACTALITLGFWKEVLCVRWSFDKALAKRMLSYAWPILVLGIAGILNQTADKILFPQLVPGQEGRVQLGIYGAAVKIAMIMALITQAFRYAYEPFVFASAKKGENSDNRATYALTMKYFIIFTLFAFLLVMAYIDVFKHLMGRDYWEGLHTVPIVMVAEILMGVYFNLSFWYKLTDRTIWGAWFSGAGCVVLIATNVLLIPHFGYIACAWAGVAGYGTATLLSYFVGQKYYPIAYPLRSIGAYVLLTGLLYVAMIFLPDFIENLYLRLSMNTVLVVLFLLYVIKRDMLLHSLPVIGKYFR
ncbi:MAG: polysaccharide biosynthesis C-terminal domain-containing protein [Bacteroidales bacterium]|nr:polysaccharide biosynthesis C-terminal domain-containing protein [Bacteroidales bacterium]